MFVLSERPRDISDVTSNSNHRLKGQYHAIFSNKSKNRKDAIRLIAAKI